MLLVVCEPARGRVGARLLLLLFALFEVVFDLILSHLQGQVGNSLLMCKRARVTQECCASSFGIGI